MREHHAKFGLFKDQDSSLTSFACCGCDVAISDEIVKSDDFCLNDPYMIVPGSTSALDLIVPRWIWLPIWHLA